MFTILQKQRSKIEMKYRFILHKSTNIGRSSTMRTSIPGILHPKVKFTLKGKGSHDPNIHPCLGSRPLQGHYWLTKIYNDRLANTNLCATLSPIRVTNKPDCKEEFVQRGWVGWVMKNKQKLPRNVETSSQL